MKLDNFLEASPKQIYEWVKTGSISLQQFQQWLKKAQNVPN